MIGLNMGDRASRKQAGLNDEKRPANRLGLCAGAAGGIGSAVAQGTGSFNRVTTAGVRRGAASSTSRAASVARSDATGRAAAATVFEPIRFVLTAAGLRPEEEASTGGVPRYSTQQEPPVATREVVPQPQSRNYFPGMRASRAIQQPVTLTARSTGVRHICTPSRSQMVGAAALTANSLGTNLPAVTFDRRIAGSSLPALTSWRRAPWFACPS